MSIIALCPINPSHYVQVEESTEQLTLVVSEPAGYDAKKILAWISVDKSREGIETLWHEAHRWAQLSPSELEHLEARIRFTPRPKQVSYCGVPAGSTYRYCTATDPTTGVKLNPRHDIINIRSIESDRDNDYGSKAQLALALLADYLEDSARAVRLYSVAAWKLQYITPADRPWLLTEIDMERVVAEAEHTLHLSWNDESGCYQDEPNYMAPEVYRKPRKEEAAFSAA